MKTHYIKIEQRYLDEVIAKRKTFEVRVNDRNYEVDDEVILCAYCPRTKQYLNLAVKVLITYILDDFKGLGENIIVFSFTPIIFNFQSDKDELMKIDPGLKLHSFGIW